MSFFDLILRRKAATDGEGELALSFDAQAEADSDGLLDSVHSDECLLKIARSGVSLFELAPLLAETAAKVEASAKEQAQMASSIASATAQMASSLEKAVGGISCSSDDAVVALESVRKWADTMKLLAINASVEAARAGDAGRTFKVVAEHVQSMAQNAGTTTKDVMKAISAMEKDISMVKGVLGEGSSSGKAMASDSVHGINRSMGSMTSSAASQKAESHKIHEMSERTRSLSEELLLSIGRLRFHVHERCRDAASELASSDEVLSMDRRKAENYLQAAFKRHPSFELFYLTDSNGQQITRNISPMGGSSSGLDALGKNWSKRPWFKEAISSEEPCVSDLYLSVATNAFCFTVSVALRDSSGELLGVLGADVNFKLLVEG